MVKKCFIEVPKGGEEQVISAYINMPDLYAPYLTHPEPESKVRIFTRVFM